jgi:isoquinoline 1-oxidoreductase
MDELAHELRVDPLEFRLRHLSDPRLSAVLLRVAERFGWGARDKSNRAGFGLALGVEKGARVATAAQVHASPSGRIEVERIVTGLECGAIVHPENLRSQVQGATVMALGGALFEALHFDQGRVLNPRFSQYRVPRFQDVPAIEVELVDRPDLPSAGAGETPMIAVAPAIANAIFDATGLRIRNLPLLPSGPIP